MSCSTDVGNAKSLQQMILRRSCFEWWPESLESICSNYSKALRSVYTRTHPRNRGHLEHDWKYVNCFRMNFCKRFYDARISRKVLEVS